MEHEEMINRDGESDNGNNGNVNILLQTFRSNKKNEFFARNFKKKFEATSNTKKDGENGNVKKTYTMNKLMHTKFKNCHNYDDTSENKETHNIQNLIDPFDIHLNYDLSNSSYINMLNENPVFETYLHQWPTLGDIIVNVPKLYFDGMSSLERQRKRIISEGNEHMPFRKVPCIMNEIEWGQLHKPQKKRNCTELNDIEIEDNLIFNRSISALVQKELFSIINNYQDLLYCEKKSCNEKEIMYIYCLHTVNHILKTRSRILHNNAELSKMINALENDVLDKYRDQGLVRPKVLIIVPFRHTCLKIVETLIAILFSNSQSGSVMNKKRFMSEFGGDTVFMPKTNLKPEDYEITFSGNTDDTFKIGISITKKTLKLYSTFYSSDIIIASALGLKMLIGAVGEKNRDYDFLSSIELLILDQTEVLLMQNWDHLIHVLNHLHLQPQKSHGTDYSRVRSWSVNGWSKYYRQTLIFSRIHAPEIHALLHKKCVNYAGKIKVMNNILIGSINQVILHSPQFFFKFDANSHVQTIRTRFEFFVTKVLPHYKDSMMNHTLIYISSYFDYVKLRNYFKKEELSFVQICEYSKDAKVARARDMFFHSNAHFLLYSERFHFFRRICIKGIRHIIFFAPPSFPHFYSELCNSMYELNQNSQSGSKSNMTITTLYSKYDVMRLSAILGTNRTAKMIESDKLMHTIITGK